VLVSSRGGALLTGEPEDDAVDGVAVAVEHAAPAGDKAQDDDEETPPRNSTGLTAARRTRTLGT
jgi:hypothetical protein